MSMGEEGARREVVEYRFVSSPRVLRERVFDAFA